jgi:hypothetical protein
MFTLSTLSRGVALGVAALALTTSPTLARPDHAMRPAPANGGQVSDLRSPGASAAPIATSSLAGTTSSSPEVVRESVSTSDDGIDWGSAGIGAGAVAAVSLLAATGLGLAQRSRRMDPVR